MSITDTSGNSSTRPDATARADAARGDSSGARYQSVDVGGGVDAPGAESGSGKSDRACAKIVWWDEWHTAEDEKVCPECSPLDHQWYEQGKGPVPPLHDNCRCKRIVVWWDCYQSDGTWEKGGRAQ